MRWKANRRNSSQAHLLRSNKSERLSSSAIWRRWKKYCPCIGSRCAAYQRDVAVRSDDRSLNLILGLNWEEMTFVLPTESSGQTIFFTVECKRLRVTTKSTLLILPINTSRKEFSVSWMADTLPVALRVWWIRHG